MAEIWKWVISQLGYITINGRFKISIITTITTFIYFYIRFNKIISIEFEKKVENNTDKLKYYYKLFNAIPLRLVSKDSNLYCDLKNKIIKNLPYFTPRLTNEVVEIINKDSWSSEVLLSLREKMYLDIREMLDFAIQDKSSELISYSNKKNYFKGLRFFPIELELSKLLLAFVYSACSALMLLFILYI